MHTKEEGGSSYLGSSPSYRIIYPTSASDQMDQAQKHYSFMLDVLLKMTKTNDVDYFMSVYLKIDILPPHSST